MTDILQEIIANKRIEVERQKQTAGLRDLQAKTPQRKVLSMRAALESSLSGIIAEFKRKSPSKGWLYPEAKVEDITRDYEKYGASACSVLTDNKFFGGSLQDLQTARQTVNLPLLRKDFIIDEYQLYQAAAAGADAILLIAAALDREQCLFLAQSAHNLQLEVLLEIHNEEELCQLNPYIDMLGVNNRNLGTFYTNTANSFRLAEQLKSLTMSNICAPLLVSESGISDADTVRRLRKVGFRGFLIGETFMKNPHPGEYLRGFIEQLID
ncbi:MAG: indole-3-glycerol phosphate synthase TrpC [Prevotellaceae bacterium]|jgi:indole-3-glycerol phosphate synthase|nr:indole-3-glycerol phosphate synthase TrpC [Prevotellaceae bacterium]